VVFYVVFQLILGSGIPSFPIFLLSGLLVWNLFNTGVSSATGSVVSNAGLVRKVSLPREILPLASVGANCVHFMLQAVVLLGAIALSPLSYDLAWLWMVLPALLVLILLTGALAILLSAINVYARDTQHLLELLLLGWFWMTPIVYQWGLPAQKLEEHGLSSGLLLLNPMVSITLALQRALYGITHFVDAAGNHQQVLPDEGQWWYLRNLGVVGLSSVVLLVVALRVFDRLEGNFAEEL